MAARCSAKAEANLKPNVSVTTPFPVHDIRLKNGASEMLHKAKQHPFQRCPGQQRVAERAWRRWTDRDRTPYGRRLMMVLAHRRNTGGAGSGPAGGATQARRVQMTPASR